METVDERIIALGGGSGSSLGTGGMATKLRAAQIAVGRGLRNGHRQRRTARSSCTISSTGKPVGTRFLVKEVKNMTTLELLTERPRAAMGSIAAAGAEKKNALLLAMADSLEAALRGRSSPRTRRTWRPRAAASPTLCSTGSRLDEDRIAGMANGIRDAVSASRPSTGRVLSEVVRPNGLVIDKVQVPLGVVAIIYESRPNVTSDAAALCRQERQRLCAPQRQGGLPLRRAPLSAALQARALRRRAADRRHREHGGGHEPRLRARS